MADLINKMREKPDHVKRTYAFWLSAGITGLIAVIWVSTLPARFAALAHPPKANAAQSATQVAASRNAPINSLTASVSDGVEKIKELFSKPTLPEPETVQLETNAYTQSSLSGAVLITDPSEAQVIIQDSTRDGSASLYTP